MANMWKTIGQEKSKLSHLHVLREFEKNIYKTGMYRHKREQREVSNKKKTAHNTRENSRK